MVCMRRSLTRQTRPLGAGLLAGLLGLAACGGDPRTGHYVGDIITATDFEQLAGWGSADRQALTRQQAHSGRTATFVGPGRAQSITYQLPLNQASVHPIKAVDLEAWVYLPSGKAAGALVVEVLPPGGGPPLYHEPLPLLGQVREFGSWQRVQHVFVLPWDLPGDAQLRIFLDQATSPEPLYLDDLTVKARE